MLVEKFKAMKWQDKVFATGELVFLTSLLPSVLGPDKPAPITSFMTGVMLVAFLFVHASFKLWAAFCLCTITAGLWFVLFAQSI